MRELIHHIEDRNISSMPATKLQKLMHMYDMNNDGHISYKEFTHLVSHITHRPNLDLNSRVIPISDRQSSKIFFF